MGKDINFSNLLLKMAENGALDSDVCQEIYRDLEYFYSQNDRHFYHEISHIVFYQEDEKNEIMALNVQYFLDQNKNNKYYDKYKKLYDHIMLAITQKKFIEDHLEKLKYEQKQAQDEIVASYLEVSSMMENFTHTFTESTENQSRKLEEQRQKITEIEERSRKITTEFVSILGIFSAVILAAFGGLEILKNILGNIERVPTGKLLVFSSLTTGAIIFVLFLLLYSLAKLTGLNLRNCNCKQEECTCNLVQKYPSIVIIYITLLFLFLLGLSEYFIDYKTIMNNIFSTNPWFQIITILVLSLLYWAVSIIFYIFMKKNKNNKVY